MALERKGALGRKSAFTDSGWENRSGMFTKVGQCTGGG